MTSNGECCKADCTRLLITNSPTGRSVAQSSYLCQAKSRRYCSISLFIRSVCPFTYGWYMVISCLLIPSFSYSTLMNRDANCGPLSLMIPRESLWSRNTLQIWRSAMLSASTLSMVRAKCACFEYRSIYVAMAVYIFPLIPLLGGSPVTRSVPMIHQSPSGMAIGSIAGFG